MFSSGFKLWVLCSVSLAISIFNLKALLAVVSGHAVTVFICSSATVWNYIFLRLFTTSMAEKHGKNADFGPPKGRP